MVFLRRDEESGRRLEGAGVYLRHPELRDYQAWAELRGASRAFLTPWEPTWPENELTRASFKEKLRRYAEDVQEDRSYPFYLFRAEDDALVGGATLNRVHRGSAQSCTLGYWVGVTFQRRGYTRTGVRTLIPFAFRNLGLHRVEAACQPENQPSRNLLLSVGFTEEGRARAFLKINGAWRDHLLFGFNDGDLLR
jgi:[ribosomal protein S5]-alanine N-acetyltransferase